MSHQVKQVGKIIMTDLSLFKRAVNALTPQQLGKDFGITVREDLKEATYWAGNKDKCDMVITANRELTSAERNSFYDIAVKITDGEDAQKRPVKHYALFADISGSDSRMRERLNLIMQRYLVEKRRAEHVENGAIEVTEKINERGQVVVSGTYLKD